MRAATVQALDAINERFYRRHSGDFSRTRQRPWKGWQRLTELMAKTPRAGRAVPAVLDVGCGNGRLLLALEAPLLYVGCDRSLSMLLQATATLAPRTHSQGGVAAVHLAELGRPMQLPFRDHSFDLVVLMGVLHHVPGYEQRARLLEACARCVADNGCLAFSTWQFEAAHGIGQRRLTYGGMSALLPRSVLEDLEPGDALLRWGPDPTDASSVLRYCHHTDDEELERLRKAAASCGLAVEACWEERTRRGFANAYTALRRH